MPLAPSASSSSAASPTIGSCVRGTSAAAPADQVATFREQALRAAVEALRDEPVFWSAKQAVKEELKAQYQSTGVQEALSKVLRATGAATALKSLAYERLRQVRRSRQQIHRIAGPAGCPLPPLPAGASVGDGLETIAWARWRWSSLLLKRLTELSAEQSQPFLRRRGQVPERGEGGGGGGSARGGGGCGDSPWRDNHHGDSMTRPIMELDRLYRLITTDLAAHSREVLSDAPSRRDGGRSSEQAMLHRGLWWGTLGVSLSTDSMEHLRYRYQDLSPTRAHLGVADVRRSASEAELCERRRVEGQALLAEPYVPELQLFARFGVPPSLRAELWARCLGAEPRTGPYGLPRLSKSVCDWEWITDDVLRLDVAEFCANDVNYFVFDEMVESLVLALSRDATVPSSCDAGPPQEPILTGPAPDMFRPTNSCEKPPGGPQMMVPPCGVVPFRGFSCYACPFAFLADVLDKAFPLFRAFYCRYLSKLHTVGQQPGTLLPLCALFESLVFTTAPHVSYHLAQMGPDAAPLRIAFPWIVTGFAGHLKADQVLWLWDRVVGFGSVQLIAVLAAAIFAFRARLVLSAKVVEDVELIFQDLTALQAMPLLQGFLFASDLSSGGGA